MSAPMVQAILEGRKTQTRRIVKSKSDLNHYNKVFVLSRDEYNNDVAPEFKEKVVAKKPMALFFRNFINDLDIECPYGNVRERLWVRETFFEAYNDRFLPTGEYCYAATHQGYVYVLDEDGGIKINKDGSDGHHGNPAFTCHGKHHGFCWKSQASAQRGYRTFPRMMRLQKVSFSTETMSYGGTTSASNGFALILLTRTSL